MQLIAIQKHPYPSSKMRFPGDQYEASNYHARQLIAVGLAKPVEMAEPEPAAAKAMTTESAPVPAPKQKRNYTRRDMVPQK